MRDFFALGGVTFFSLIFFLLVAKEESVVVLIMGFSLGVDTEEDDDNGSDAIRVGDDEDLFAKRVSMAA